MPDVATLTSQVQQLGDSFDSWSRIANALLAITSVVGVLYFGATIVQTSVAKRLRVSQDLLGRAKDRQLASELKSKDVEIGAAQQAAGKANERASANEKEAARLRKEAETERITRLKMQESLAPRSIEQVESVKELQKFKGVSVIIESIGDEEAWRLAEQIAWTLDQAGWNILPGMKRGVDVAFEGVAIQWGLDNFLQHSTGHNKDDVSLEAAPALADTLAKNSNIEAQARLIFAHKDIPPNTLLVQVGWKPYSFSSDTPKKKTGFLNNRLRK